MKTYKFRALTLDGQIVYGELSQEDFGTEIDFKSIAQLVGYGIGRHHVYEGDIVHFTHEGIRYEYKAQLTPCAVADNGCYIGAEQIATREVEARL